MVEQKPITLEYLNHIAIVKLNVPKKMNAISFEMFAELEKTF